MDASQLSTGKWVENIEVSSLFLLINEVEKIAMVHMPLRSSEQEYYTKSPMG